MLPGLYGSWMCSPPLDMGEIVSADCLRFIPSASYANPTDPMFNEGPLNVMTYLSSRAENKITLMKETSNANLHQTKSMFEQFTVRLSAVTSFSSAMSGLVLALCATNF